MKNKGITLIALVITIVVLIILAAVAINLSLGNNGIFNRAKTGKELYQNAEEYEKAEISGSSNVIDSYIGGLRGTSPINFSTSEQDTGLKWIDGKTIYQKTINFGTLTNGAWKYVNHNISNIDFICSVYGIAKTNGDGFLPLPYGENSPYAIYIFATKTAVGAYTLEYHATRVTNVYITVQYTKTSN